MFWAGLWDIYGIQNSISFQELYIELICVPCYFTDIDSKEPQRFDTKTITM